MHRKLDLASALLDAGVVPPVRDLAAGVLREAHEPGDSPLKAQALLLLARHDFQTGRFRRAIQAAQASLPLFQKSGELAAEACALSVLSMAHSSLGRNEEAVESALLSVRLGELVPERQVQVHLFNALGVAYLWGRSFGSAQAALHEAERLAWQCTPTGDVVLPRVNLAWLELQRLFHERYFNGQLPDTATLAVRLARCRELLADHPPPPGAAARRFVAWRRTACCAQAMLLAWTGQADAAQAELDVARGLVAHAAGVHVSDYFVTWVDAEVRWARGDAEGAQAAAAALVAGATHAEFEQMAYVGHTLAIHLNRACGRIDAAFDEERQLRRRELRVQADKLESRDGVVRAHLEVRASRQDLQRLNERSKELERLSYEDALTAIANRRGLEQRLAGLLGNGQAARLPLCLALIDLDDFKAVNDRVSHLAGDEVLKSVAQAIRAAVREADLPARYGGDEFVVVFPHTPLDVATQVCERIVAMIAALRWPHLAADVRVTASIGVTQALPGDSAVQLLLRSDEQMFRAKGGRPRVEA